MGARLSALDTSSPASLYAAYMKEGGDASTTDQLRAQGAAKIERLRANGWDLGGVGEAAPAAARARVDAIYAQARQALYAVLDPNAIAAAAPHHVRARTRARDREDYLAHPASGESIGDEDVARIRRALASAGGRRPQVQIVVSDGLNANAVNDNIGAILPPLRRELAAAALHVSDIDVILDNGRVRAGYHAGAIVDADVIVHFLGERPGTGLDTLSSYLTYGRDAAGQTRWSSDLDHSATTAVCGIHRRARPPAEAVGEITRLLRRIVATRRSGVALHD
jgi:ethanolamine ammonia-lyase large subunit